MTRQKQERRIVTDWDTLNGRTIRIGGVTEVATDLGVDATRVTTWTNRKRMNETGQRPPEPVITRAMGPLFDVDAWREYRGMARRTVEETEEIAKRYANIDRERMTQDLADAHS